MAFEGDSTFGYKSASEATLLVADRLASAECVGFRQTQTEKDYEDGRACTEPKEGPPAVGSGVYKCAGEGCGEEVAERVALLQHARNDTTSSVRTILQCCSCGISVQTPHCYAKQGPDRQKLAIRLGEASTELQGDKQNIVDYEWPVSHTCEVSE